MKQFKSCGFIILSDDSKKFLLLKHSDRFDLPKGHIEENETELECAIRELNEETGLTSDDISIDSNFRFEVSYLTQYKRLNNETVNKTLVVFLANLLHETEVNLTEHNEFIWFNWNKDISFKEESISAVIVKIGEYFNSSKDKSV